MRFLRTNTATRVTVGPFLDKTDGVTPEVALTVTSEKLTLMVDTAGVPTLILDTAPTASGGANDMVHVTGDDAGFYDLELAAADVNYLGRAMLALTDAATHCPVFHEFMILPAMIYDAFILGTDTLQADVTQWLGTAAVTPSVAGVPEVDLTHVAGATTNVAALATNVDAILTDTADMQPKLGTPAGASVSADVAAVKVDTAAILVDTGTTLDGRIPAALVGGRMDSNLGAISGSTNGVAALQRSADAIVRCTVGAASTTTNIVTSACAPSGAVADQFKGRIVIFDANTTTTALRGQATDITASSNAATPELTVTALTTAPVSGDTFVIV